MVFATLTLNVRGEVAPKMEIVLLGSEFAAPFRKDGFLKKKYFNLVTFFQNSKSIPFFFIIFRLSTCGSTVNQVLT